MCQKFLVSPLVFSLALIFPLLQAEVPAAVASKYKPINIVVADSIKIMQDSLSGNEITKKIGDLRKKYDAELNADGEKFEKEAKAFEDKEKMMAPDAAAKAKQDLIKKQRDLQTKAQDLQGELKMEAQKLTEAISIELQKAATEFATAYGIDVIVDKYSGRVIYSNETKEPNKEIIDLMNKYHTAKAPAAKPAATQVPVAAKK